jgi:hypothetical protein
MSIRGVGKRVSFNRNNGRRKRRTGKTKRRKTNTKYGMLTVPEMNRFTADEGTGWLCILNNLKIRNDYYWY